MSNDIFQTVRNAVDIVEVIGEHIALRKAGKEFKGLCPFHDDHRPSMAVVPQKQIFKCFVCGAGGDVFQFVKEYHKMSWGEALRFLAQRGGVKLPELPPRPGFGGAKSAERASVREQVAETNERACSYFEKFLRSPDGKPGLDYLLSRGLTDETIRRFRLGYSPDTWTGLCTAAARVGIKAEQLFLAGLTKKRADGSPYDAFVGRVIFPILDATGRVIAFGGRILVEKRDEAGNITTAKYLNSPETPLFNKSETLYGINHAKPAIIKSQTAVIVEGYMDVIACHQAGVTNVLATLGTALTPEHARVLRRFCQTVVLVFDSDEAGFRAADRALETFVREPLDIKLASVPDGKDPCDFCMSHGGEAFAQVVAGGTEAMTYQWQRLQREFHATDSVSARQEAASVFLRFVAQALESPGSAGTVDPIRRGLLLSKISDLLRMPVADVSTTLKRLAKLNAPRGALGPAPGAETPAEPLPREPTKGAAEAAEAWVLGALLTEPELYEKLRHDISLAHFPADAKIAEALMEYLEHATELSQCSLAEFCSLLDDRELITQAIRLQGLVEASGKTEQNLADGWKWLCARLEQNAREANSAGPVAAADIQRRVEEARQRLARGEVNWKPRQG